MKPAVAIVVAAALAGCGEGPKQRDAGAPVSKAERPAAEQQIRALLDRRAAALEAGRARAYAATASGAQARRDRRVGSRARDLGAHRISLRPVGGEVGGERARMEVELRYEIRGAAGVFASRRRVEARRTRRGWRITRVRRTRERPPWEIGRFARLRSPHFVILAPAGVLEDVLTEALEGGYSRTSEVLVRPRLDPRYLVVVAAGARQARALTETIRGVGGLAAIADAEVREEGPAKRVTEVVSQRLLVVYDRFLETDSEGRLRVVTHELTHAALARATSGRTPAWLLEGVALYVSGDRRVGDAAALITAGGSASVRRALTLSGLSRPDGIARLDGPGQRAAYSYSSAAAFYIAARYGERRLLRLYDAFNQERIAGASPVAVTDAAVREVLRRPLERLERDLRRWILTRAVVSPLSP